MNSLLRRQLEQLIEEELGEGASVTTSYDHAHGSVDILFRRGGLTITGLRLKREAYSVFTVNELVEMAATEIRYFSSLMREDLDGYERSSENSRPV